MRHTPVSPGTKIIKAHLWSATNPTGLLETLKIAPTTLSTIAGNASIVFPTSLLSASAILFNHLFKTPSFYDGEPRTPSPPKTPV